MDRNATNSRNTTPQRHLPQARCLKPHSQCGKFHEIVRGGRYCGGVSYTERGSLQT